MLFGLKTSLFLFDLFTKAVKWIMLQKFQNILHYFDDFFLIAADTKKALKFGQIFDKICKELGISVNHAKDISGTLVDFLGIELDTIHI